MVISLTEALNAAKKFLDNGGYAYYFIKSGELIDNDSKWMLKFLSVAGMVNVIVDSNTGEVLKVSTDQQ